ncbi:unnamed protein product [marine sediment metagenome]|uniref:Uncharacterized protein n=1 Tax=marine sediment metagenome TaxID=412755 RepID=X1BDJ1_9ZZZZ
MALDIGSLGVSMVLNIIIVIIMLFVAIKKAIIPVLEAVIDEKTKETQNMMKAAASSLGQKSGEARQLKKMEKMMIGDIMEQYPELEMALEYFSPETAEMIKQHPQRAITLIARYKPILDEILGRDNLEKQTWQL